MIYLSSFALTHTKLKNPNIYPYNVFCNKYVEPFVFAPITIFYGSNGCGKSTLLNLIAQKLGIEGAEQYAYGQNYINKYLDECAFDYGEDENGVTCKIPKESRYIKSEDVLFEIKKIQQEDALERGYIYEKTRQGSTKEEAKQAYQSYIGLNSVVDILQFAQEKYSNGETAMQMLTDILVPDACYLLDEPEVSLSPQNQVKLAEEINTLAHYCSCQFLIATHSPFLLGTLQGKIYDMDQKEIEEKKWSELENVKFFYDFFKKHEGEFS
ncbi:MAG: AAA family ATPase [Roseburia sp.]